MKIMGVGVGPSKTVVCSRDALTGFDTLVCIVSVVVTYVKIVDSSHLHTIH